MDGGIGAAERTIRPRQRIGAAQASLGRHIGKSFETRHFMVKLVPPPVLAGTILYCGGWIGDAGLTLSVARRPLDLLLKADGFAGMMSHKPALRPLLAELMCEADLLTLEAQAEATIRLTSIDTAPDQPALPGCPRIGLQCSPRDRPGAEPFTVSLALTEAALPALEALLAPVALPRRRLANLPVGLIIEHARVRLTLADLKRAAPGDVILAPGATPRRLTAGPLWWPIILSESKLEVTGPMEKDQNTPPAVPASSGLDSLPVELCFELGRLTRPLKEVEALQPGHVLVLPNSDASRIAIMVNGQIIGGGDIVSVGDEAGIRIRWIGADDPAIA